MVPAAVTLTGQRVALDARTAQLTVSVVVKNELDVMLTAVEVGWLLAPDAATLARVDDPGVLFLAEDDPKHVKAPAGITALRRIVDAAVPPHGSAPVTFTVPLAAATPDVYRTYILNYALADASLPLLLRLLHGSAAADERAAVTFFALASPARERLAARARLNAERWSAELEARTSAPVPQRPSASELHERVFLVRAIGVVGGPRAEQVLTTLRDRPDLASFDELLRVVLIDRLRGTRLETPLAFAVPASSRGFRDVVDVALQDARNLLELARNEGEVRALNEEARRGDGSEGRLQTSDGRLPMSDSRLPMSDGRPPMADSRLPTSDGRLPMSDSRLPTTDSRAPTSDGQSPTASGDAASGDVGPSVRPFDLSEQLGGLAVVVGAAVVTLWFLRRNK